MAQYTIKYKDQDEIMVHKVTAKNETEAVKILEDFILAEYLELALTQEEAEAILKDLSILKIIRYA